MSKKPSVFIISVIGGDNSQERLYADLFNSIVASPLSSEITDNDNIKRADQISEGGLISEQIIAHLLEDDLVLADLRGLNPNVMYELGIRHTTGRPTILFFPSGTPLPFDIKDVRAIQYQANDLVSLESAKNVAQKFVKKLIKNNFSQTELNPVTRRTMGRRKFIELALEAMRLIFCEPSDNRIRVSLFEVRGDELQNTIRVPSGNPCTNLTFRQGQGYAGILWKEYQQKGKGENILAVNNIPAREDTLENYEEICKKLNVLPDGPRSSSMRSFLLMALIHPHSAKLWGIISLDSKEKNEFENVDKKDYAIDLVKRLQEALFLN